MRILTIFLLLSMLAGCASTPRTDLRLADVYKRHASDETVSGVRYTSVRGWRPVGDEGVLIEFDRQRHYLFLLNGACRSEIQFAPTIVFSSTPVNRVDQFDRIALNGRWCRIQEIREVDFKAVEAEVAALNAALEAPRKTEESDVIHKDDYSGGT
ncbi:MAG: DUF6491 family protein [Wenzhouxiangella sp.]|jgi:hypothetical protein|nr:DUF6491 family protein [Wenzhouxiangella sp.]